MEPDDLLSIDYGSILKAIHEDPNSASHYGKMTLLSEALLGGLLASSYSERENSQAKLVMTTGRTLLAPDELEHCVVLRMNTKFLEYMRANYEEDPETGEIRPKKKNNEGGLPHL